MTRLEARRAGDARPSVLLAEDDPTTLRIIAESLRADGCEVTCATDGGRLLVEIAAQYSTSERPREAFDVIVSDIRMPVCSGLEIVESLRRARWSTPVILMTARVDARTQTSAERLGAMLLQKPFELADLKAAIYSLIGASTPKPSPAE